MCGDRNLSTGIQTSLSAGVEKTKQVRLHIVDTRSQGCDLTTLNFPCRLNNSTSRPDRLIFSTVPAVWLQTDAPQINNPVLISLFLHQSCCCRIHLKYWPRPEVKTDLYTFSQLYIYLLYLFFFKSGLMKNSSSAAAAAAAGRNRSSFVDVGDIIFYSGLRACCGHKIFHILLSSAKKIYRSQKKDTRLKIYSCPAYLLSAVDPG